MRWAADHGLFSLPPDEHARVRRLVSAAFTPRAIARMDAAGEGSGRAVRGAAARPQRVWST